MATRAKLIDEYYDAYNSCIIGMKDFELKTQDDEAGATIIKPVIVFKCDTSTSFEKHAC